MTTIPIVMSSAGLTPQTPAALNAQIIALAQGYSPGLTANLPGALIEDISSTDTAACVIMDQSTVDLVNSLTPYGANLFLLNQLGNIYGVAQGGSTNTSVYVVFSSPSDGWVIPPGFIVSDGTYQYIVQEGGVIGSGGTSAALYALASVTGTWAVPAGTVTQLVTSVPSAITLTVTNPSAGTPSSGPQDVPTYRASILEAGLATAQGVPYFVKTALNAVPGVQARLVAMKQVNGGGWEVICGGGDPYAVANAIFSAVPDVNLIVGSTMSVTAITNANPGKVTTYLNHGYTTGQVVQINGVVGMTAINGVNLTITVVDEKNFTVGVDTTGYASYVSGGVVTPNFRNQMITLTDYPDTYNVTFVVPPQQTVAVALTWNSDATNPVSATSMAAAGGPAIVTYINSIAVGQPINEFELNAVFQAATESILDNNFLTRMVWTITINGIVTAPSSGTGAVYGDPESYFYTTLASVTIAQG